MSFFFCWVLDFHSVVGYLLSSLILPQELILRL
ncbi:unnamed protein product, partial [Vitis vinifera]|uniref:Uncharacterized protein n=1 Tax=Vitis vinifera TaxID=29760 RepID=D7SKN1_VITVI